MISGRRVLETTLTVSFDMKSLFTNVPVEEVMPVIINTTELDTRTTFIVDCILKRVEFRLRRHTSSIEESSTNKKIELPWDLHFPLS